MRSAVYDRLEQLLQAEIRKRYIYSVLLGVQSQDGRIDFRGAAGAATVDSPYLIASITKMVTAATLMQLVDERQIDLDAPVTDYLAPDLLDGIHVYKGVDYSHQLKVYQLVHQTSGLPHYYEDKPKNGVSLSSEIKRGRDRALDLADMLAITRSLSPKFAPDANGGRKSHYSDMNYQLLGEIIETVTGKPIGENFQTRVFDPLGLEQTYLYDCRTPRDGPPPLPVYYRDQALNIPLFASSDKAAGGVVSTLSDSLRFLRAYFDGALFDRKHFARMMARWNTIIPPVIKYGYGLMRFQVPRAMNLFRYSPELIGHSGSIGSFAFYVPKEGLYLVGTFNQADKPSRPFQFMLRTINAILKAG